MNKNVRLTWEFVKDISAATDVASVQAILKSLAKQFGLNTAFGGVIPKNLHREGDLSKYILVADQPVGWTARYLECGYVHRDPIIKGMATPARYFSWQEAYKSCPSREDAKVIQGEAQEFGLHDGFAVPVQMLGGNSALMSYGGLHMEMSPEEKNALSFATNYAVGQLIFETWRPKGEFQALTDRETDCLLWASEGKTDWEISVILAIAVSTVEKHMLSARTKLGAVNKHHAIAKAMRYKIVR